MQIIFNDFSLNGQFRTVDHFCCSTMSFILPCLDFCQKYEYELLKSYSTYNCKVTNQYTLKEILYQSNGNPVVSKLKNMLIQLFYQKPYWNDSKKTPVESNATCITEAFYRSGILLSYKGSKYDVSKTIIEVSNKEETVCNASEKRQLLESLDELSDISGFSLSNSIVIPNSRLKIEVRADENASHKEPHFHISNKSGKLQIVYYFKDFEQHEGKNPTSSETKCIKDWLKEEKNRVYLIELWNYYHPKYLVN